RCVAIYPEGTLTRDPDLWPMTGKTGAARVALETQCPVIPVAQWGAQEILARYAKKPKIFPRKVMHVRAGPPVDLADLYGLPLTALVLKDATERIMAAITRELEVLRGEKAPTERFDARTAGLPRIGKYDPGEPQLSLPGREGSPSGDKGARPESEVVAPGEKPTHPQPGDEEGA